MRRTTASSCTNPPTWLAASERSISGPYQLTTAAMRWDRHRRWQPASGLGGRIDGPLEHPPTYQATTTDGGGGSQGNSVGLVDWLVRARVRGCARCRAARPPARRSARLGYKERGRARRGRRLGRQKHVSWPSEHAGTGLEGRVTRLSRWDRSPWTTWANRSRTRTSLTCCCAACQPR